MPWTRSLRMQRELDSIHAEVDIRSCRALQFIQTDQKRASAAACLRDPEYDH